MEKNVKAFQTPYGEIFIETVIDSSKPILNEDGLIETSNKSSKDAERKFEKVASTINAVTKTVIEQIEKTESEIDKNSIDKSRKKLKMEEIELKFGLSLTGEGNVWIIKGKAETTIEVTITWKHESV